MKIQKLNYLIRIIKLKVHLSSKLEFKYKLQFNTNNENKDKTSQGKVSWFKFSMPVFDIQKIQKIEKSKLEVLKQKVNVTDMQNELVYEYEQILNQINTYDEFKKNNSRRI